MDIKRAGWVRFRREGHGNRSEYTGENEENDRGFGAETDRDGKDSLDRPAVRRRARSPSAYHDSCDLPRQRRIQAWHWETGRLVDQRVQGDPRVGHGHE